MTFSSYFPAVQTRPWASHSFNKLKEKLPFASGVSYSYSRVTFDRSTRVHQRKILSLAASATVVLFVFLVQSQYFIQEHSESSWNARIYLCRLYTQLPAFIKPAANALMPCSPMCVCSDTRSVQKSFEMSSLPVTATRDFSLRTVSVGVHFISFIFKLYVF